MLFVKIAKCIGFCVYHRSYLLWSPVIKGLRIVASNQQPILLTIVCSFGVFGLFGSFGCFVRNGLIEKEKGNPSMATICTKVPYFSSDQNDMMLRTVMRHIQTL